MIFFVAHCIIYVRNVQNMFKIDEIKPSGGWDLAKWLERLTANVKVAIVLGSIPSPSSDTVESEGRQMKQVRKNLL
jgi:hypothetical protein